jgi:GTP-binding protein Era
MAADPATPHRAGVVALVGRPNAGKSTLLNQIVGTKLSIVSDKPQTTRNQIRGVLTRPDAQVVFLDTPGIHRPLHEMNRRMMSAAMDALTGVDVVCVLTDATEPFGGGDRYLVELLGRAQAPVFLLVNKIDLVPRKTGLLPLIALWSKAFAFAEIFPISAARGEGVEALLAAIVVALPPGERLFPEDQVTDVTERFLAGEIVREKVLHHTREEIPYATSVLIDDYAEPEGDTGVVRITASILVERDGQKGILVGKGGEMIKRIGSEARHEIEAMLGRRVFLGLEVKVRRGWRDDQRLLDRLSLGR